MPRWRLLKNGLSVVTTQVKMTEAEIDRAEALPTREVGHTALWTLSSAKPGFGVEQLQDNCLDTYWQSDGSQPHVMTAQFRRKTTISSVLIYADYHVDESYTPAKISFRVGNDFQDLREVEMLELIEPEGWIMVPLFDAERNHIRTYVLQMAIVQNHQSGRDTHVRQIKINSPAEDHTMTALDFPPTFSTVEFYSQNTIR